MLSLCSGEILIECYPGRERKRGRESFSLLLVAVELEKLVEKSVDFAIAACGKHEPGFYPLGEFVNRMGSGPSSGRHL